MTTSAVSVILVLVNLASLLVLFYVAVRLFVLDDDMNAIAKAVTSLSRAVAELSEHVDKLKAGAGA